MKIQRPLFVLFFVLAVSIAFGQRRSAEPPPTPEQFEQQVVELTNAERAKHDLPPLKAQSLLADAARWMARDLAGRREFEHTDSRGRDIDPRLPDFGFKRYSAIGENIAGGQRTPADVVAGWMKSPGHRANILNPDFREIGVGLSVQANSRFRTYWVQDFGARYDTYPVVINDEAAVTQSPKVSLYVYGEKWAEQMRVSNDGETWTAWRPYRSEIAWSLEPGRGERTVFVETRKGETVRRAQDTIELRPPAGNRP